MTNRDCISITDLHNVPIIIKHAHDLIKILTNNTVYSLQLLSEFENIISCKKICELLEMNTSVTTISVNTNNENIKLLFDTLKFNTSIEHIFLTINNIKDDTVRHITNILKTNDKITYLVISNYNNNIDLGYFAEMLKINKMLRTIAITTTSGFTLGIEHVVKSLKDNPRIIQFYLSDIRISDHRQKIRKYCERNSHNIWLKSTMIQDL
jgi:hypothetical protein